jgi:hypothetical protein
MSKRIKTVKFNKRGQFPPGRGLSTRRALPRRRTRRRGRGDGDGAEDDDGAKDVAEPEEEDQLLLWRTAMYGAEGRCTTINVRRHLSPSRTRPVGML